MKLLIHSQASTVAPLKLGMDKQFYPTIYNEWLLIHARIFKLIRCDPFDFAVFKNIFFIDHLSHNMS